MSKAEVQALQARVVEAVAAPAEVAGVVVTVGVSIGTAISDRSRPIDRDGLVSAADARMYERKRRTDTLDQRGRPERQPLGR
jgi:GGDEF domain-containing protein